LYESIDVPADADVRQDGGDPAEVPADVVECGEGIEDVLVEEIRLLLADVVAVSPREWAARRADREVRVVACEAALGYTFNDRAILANALTHSSSTSDKSLDNERLEFFGDAVLDLVIREYLYHNYPNRQEGDLTEAKSAIVCRVSLVNAAKALDLRSYLTLGRGVGRRRGIPDSLLADAYEAVVAAVYLDGGYAAARDFIMRSLADAIPHAVERANAANHKSTLQKILQQARLPLPAYRVMDAIGPEHSRTFKVAVLVNGVEMGIGQGSSKKAAQQEAARAALERLAARGRTA
jgi:ribonuclease-3